jgi:co-chaperonin GroES (HSP10)|tara:strand:+ start:870 stop:1181 length:312 start_codon:yes stop_codon:yes gene_type:complete
MVEKLKAYDSKYLVVEDDNTMTKGGLHIPGELMSVHGYGVIKSAGQGRVNEFSGETIKPRLKAGDRVVFIKHSQMIIEHEDVKHFVLTDHEIVATLHTTKKGK